MSFKNIALMALFIGVTGQSFGTQPRFKSFFETTFYNPFPSSAILTLTALRHRLLPASPLAKAGIFVMGAALIKESSHRYLLNNRITHTHTGEPEFYRVDNTLKNTIFPHQEGICSNPRDKGIISKMQDTGTRWLNSLKQWIKIK